MESVARMSRKTLARDGFLNALAYVWKGDRFVIVGCDFSRVGKAEYAAALRRVCMELEADTFLLVTEIWAARARTDGMDDMMGEVAKRPGAYEAVLFHLESPDGTWMCASPIVRMEGQGPAFPMPRYWYQGPASGVFTEFIPDKKASAYERKENPS